MIKNTIKKSKKNIKWRLTSEKTGAILQHKQRRYGKYPRSAFFFSRSDSSAQRERKYCDDAMQWGFDRWKSYPECIAYFFIGEEE